MLDVITIGSATFDVFLKSKDFSVESSGQYLTGRAECMPLGAKIEVGDITFATGGGATNAAVSFSRKGLKSGAIIRLGKDASGREVMEKLAREGVITSFAQEAPKNVRTGYSIILITLSGERSVLTYRGASNHLSASRIHWEECEAKWFYMSSLAGDVDLARAVVEQAHLHHRKVAWNPGSRELHHGLKKLKGLLKHVEVLILNQEEAALLTGLPFKETTEIFLALREVVPGIIIMTRGPEGVLVAADKHLYNAGTFPEKERADRTGAGDAFGSGFVAGLIMDGGIKEALRIGSANATSVIEHVGAKEGLLTLRQLKEARWRNLSVEQRLL